MRKDSAFARNAWPGRRRVARLTRNIRDRHHHARIVFHCHVSFQAIFALCHHFGTYIADEIASGSYRRDTAAVETNWLQNT